MRETRILRQLVLAALDVNLQDIEGHFEQVRENVDDGNIDLFVIAD